MEVIDPTSETVAAQDPWVARAQARIGTVLRHKWRLDALLGIGGMACVYAGTHRNGMRAAVKVLHPELSANPDVRTRFLREGYVANSVGHPGIVVVLDDDISEDGALFLVTELLEGETLEDRRLRAGGRLPEGEVAAFADQLLDVLVAAHAKGVVHRDLKPENLYLTREGAIKVLDFGIARLREFHSGGGGGTRSGAAMGTPSYMPPEQARGLWDEVDGASDLWAVGATMFCLLSGRSVHDGRTPNEVLLSAMMRSAPPVATVAPEVSPSLAHVVDVALAFDKASRWTDAATMLGALRRSSVPVATMAALTLPDPPPDWVPPTGSTRRLNTARPVAVTMDPPFPSGTPSSAAGLPRARSWLGAAVAIGAVVLVGLACVVGVAVAWSRSTLRRPAPVLALSALPPPADLTSAPSGAASSPPPPASAPSSSSLAASAAPAPPPSATAAMANPAAAARRPAAAAAPHRPPPASECTPPYVVDPATGKKKWKEECL